MEYSSQQIAEVLKELGMDDELIAYMTKRGQRQKQLFHASWGDPAFLIDYRHFDCDDKAFDI